MKGATSEVETFLLSHVTDTLCLIYILITPFYFIFYG